MQLVEQVTGVTAFKVQDARQVWRLTVMANGTVSTPGWTGLKLSPRYDLCSQDDGLMVFDFNGEAPTDPFVLSYTDIASHMTMLCPDWVTKVAVNGYLNGPGGLPADLTEPVNPIAARAQNASVKEKANLGRGGPVARVPVAFWQSNLCSYDDSFQPTGTIQWQGAVPHLEMKKLSHTIVATVEGPSYQEIVQAFQEAAVVGLVAAIIAACATDGAALPAAVEAFTEAFKAALTATGLQYALRIDDQSTWVYWYT